MGSTATFRTLYVLPSGQYELDGIPSDLAAAIERLGAPATTRVNVAACTAERSPAVLNAVRSVQSAGYDSVGFIVADASTQPACGR